MKINDKIFSLPPYISTTWHNIASIHMDENILVVTPFGGDVVKIPGLKPEVINDIFTAHARFLEISEEANKNDEKIEDLKNPFPFSNAPIPSDDFPIRFGFGTMDSLGASMQHNPAQSSTPDLPKEILSKIASIARILAPEEIAGVPKPVSNCNCVYCQIARAIGTGIDGNEDQGEIVPDEELHFQQWDISQAGENLFNVVNRLDNHEHYNVFLGHPIGCTCGKENCEHILAVLKS